MHRRRPISPRNARQDPAALSPAAHLSLLVLLIAGLLSCTAHRPAEPPPSRGVLRVVTEAAFPPFNDLGDNGEPVGLEIDLFEQAAARAGYEVRWLIQPDFPELFTMIDDGKADAIASTVGITPQRRRLYLFTRPYFQTEIAVIVRASDARIRQPEDIASRTVGAPRGTTSATIAQELAAEEVRDFATSNAAINALLAGQIDAYIIDEVEARELVVGRAVRMLEDPAAREGYGFLFARSRKEARDRVDHALGEMQQAGRLEALAKLHEID